MTAERLTIRPKPREIAASYIARLASAYGVRTRDFALDMGLSMRRILISDGSAIAALCELGDVGGAAQTMISWSGQPIANAKMAFRSERFILRSLRQPDVRACPICLHEDARDHPDQAGNLMAIRGDWLLRDVRICVYHKHPLVTLWRREPLSSRYDIQARLAEIAPRIFAGAFHEDLVDPTPYDLWLDSRLRTGSDRTWLAETSLQAAILFCRLLGEVVRRESVEFTTTRESSHVVGFEIARGGRDAIRYAFHELASSATGYNDGPRAAYGGLFTALDQTYAHDRSFDPFRDLLREHLIRTWPIAAGEVVLGTPLSRRRIHSIKSAAIETGLKEDLIERVLVSEGIVDGDSNLPLTRRTFPADRSEPLLARLPRFLGTVNMRRAMGATKVQFDALVACMLIRPAVDRHATKRPWDPEDGTAFLASLLRDAPGIASNDDGWEHIHMSTVRRGVPIVAVVEGVRNGRIGVGRRADLRGYAGVFVRRRDIDEVFKSVTRSAVTASEFGRSLGLHNEGSIVRLVKDGHTPSTNMRNARTNRTDTCLTDENIAAFRARFVVRKELAGEWSVHWKTAAARLAAAGIKPFQAGGQTYAGIFLRADIPLADLSSSPSCGKPRSR